MNNIRFVLSITLFGMLLSCSDDDTSPIDVIEVPEGFTLISSDEFESSEINTAFWNFQNGDGTDFNLPAGWGNNELQIYTDNADNASIQEESGNSVLAITAHKDGTGAYTSARLTTKDLMSLRYGRVDIRAKMPQGQGLWPAIWMLGDNIDEIDWPGCGEIDIVELLGSNPSVIYNTIHYVNSENRKGEEQNVFRLNSGDFSNDYHIFTLEWTPDFIIFKLDEQLLKEMSIGEDMKEFQRSFYLLLNVAVGGFWPGNPDATTVFPQTMYVDYVRVFSIDGLQKPSEPPLDIDEETIGQNIEATIALNAIKEGFTDLGAIEIISFGGGGEPLIKTSETAIDGDSSLVYDFPGGAWGGAYFQMNEGVDISAYSFLKFSLNKPADLVNAEIKLESSSTNSIVFLKDYQASDVGNGFMEYTIPLTDFIGLDLSAITVPFAMWNAQDLNDNFVTATVLIDNIYFAN